jgi:hypothetical protein
VSTVAVVDVVARMFVALDDHDWESVIRCLAPTVHRDYSSLTGADPDDIDGPDLVAEWRAAIGGLDAHQHLLGLPVVDVPDDAVPDGDGTGEAARASVPVVGTHVLAGDPGSPWVVGGTYRMSLRRIEDLWRITAITLDTRWQTGDRTLLERAAARAADEV